MVGNRYIRILYKVLAAGLITYGLLWGLLRDLPRIEMLAQTSRNLFYHLPMWFTMYLIMGVSLVYAILHLRGFKPEHDLRSREAAKVGVGFGLCGLFTGIIWSRVTWGANYPDSDFNAWWSWDPKQTMSLAALLIYIAYFILRSSIADPYKRARIAAVYNVFAASSLIPLTLIIPRILGGLHPGANGGGPLFDNSAMSGEYRWILYPSILGFMLLSLWLFELRARTAILTHTLQNEDSHADDPA